jgi:predicted dehydrogenase
MGNDVNGRRLRGGMVGGAPGAFIGPVHRMAATMDGEAEFVAGCFSRDPGKSREAGRKLQLDPSRVYGSYREMAAQEAKRPAGERLDFVSIVVTTS